MVAAFFRGTARVLLAVLSFILWVLFGILAAALYTYSILIGQSRRVANKRNCR